MISARALRYLAGSRRRRRAARPLLVAASGLLPRRPPPADPVFVVGSPRSGTSLLFEVLDRSPSLASLGGESHLLWELFHPSDAAGWTSHALDATDVTDRERRALYWMIRAIAGGRRYLDKSPRNALRIGYLSSLFPTARFVFLKRDGRAAVSSLLTAWRSNDPRFPGTSVPRRLAIAGYHGPTWRFLVPPGWEAYASGRTLGEVCAFQWVAANEAILEGREGVPRDRWVEVAYEELVVRPRELVEALLARLGLPADPATLAHAERLDRHPTRAVTAPRPEKWREENPEEVARVLPLIAPTMRRLGYDVTEDALG